jgi:DNA-binding response OmpR family regulator
MGHIAIVDDSVDALELFQFVLQDDAHEFSGYTSGEEFLKQFSPGKFHLVLLDLALPQMDGFEIFRRLRTLDAVVPVVAITARAEKREKERALAAGFCDYFVKPIMQIDEFRRAIHSHVGECSNPPYPQRFGT